MIVQVKKDNNNSSEPSEKDNFKRFEDEGVVFKAKLIGSELVLEPRGDKMCQNSIQRLKAIIKGTNSHKKRVVLKVSYDGVKVYDEKTNEILHHHEVPQISFIASDDTDTRTFGYVGDVPNKAHQFVCFKTAGPAITVISVINSLFEAVVEKKKQAEKEKEEEKEKKIISDDDIFGPVTDTTIPTTTPPTKPAPTTAAAAATTTTTTTAANLISSNIISAPLAQAPVASRAAGFATNITPSSVASSISKDQVDLIDDSGIMAMPWPSTPIPVTNPHPVPNRSLIYNHSSVSLSDAPLNRQSSFTSQSVKNDSFVDRYAVFNDIDNLPSIFESTSLNSVNKLSMNNINSSTGSILEPANSSGSANMGYMFGKPGIGGMPKPNSSATMRQIPNFHMAAAHNNFSKSFNTTYLQQTSSASSGFASVDQDISSTSAGARSTSTLEANMFRRTNPFDDDFFA